MALAFQKIVVSQKSVDLSKASTALVALRRSGNAGSAKVEAAAETLISDSLALDSYAKIDVRKPFVTMAAAHAALLKALQNPKASSADALAAITEFFTEASAVDTAISKLTTGSSSSSSSGSSKKG